MSTTLNITSIATYRLQRVLCLRSCRRGMVLIPKRLGSDDTCPKDSGAVDRPTLLNWCLARRAFFAGSVAKHQWEVGALDRLCRLIPSLTAAGNAADPQIENRSRYTSFREIPRFSKDQRTTKAPVIPRKMSAPVPNPPSPATLPAAQPASAAASNQME